MKEEPKDLWLYENEAFSEGFETVCGVDEAGRGPLAGPVCAAAVILPKGLVIDGLNDSKKLTEKSAKHCLMRSAKKRWPTASFLWGRRSSTGKTS